MRSRRSFILLLIASLLIACNLPLFAPAAPTDTPTAAVSSTVTETLPPPSPTLTPTPPGTATATIVPTPSTPQVTPISVNVNCRSGPDVAYDAVSVLLLGDTTEVAGRNEDSSWWYVHDPTNPGGFCWIAASVVNISGPTGGIGFVAPPPPIVTHLTVGADFPNPAACGGPNAVEFSGDITTNGATSVKYQWEITGDKTNTTSPETLNFTKAGTKDVPSPGAYSVDCGNYTITLHVLTPNNTKASKNFRVRGP